MSEHQDYVRVTGELASQGFDLETRIDGGIAEGQLTATAFVEVWRAKPGRPFLNGRSFGADSFVVIRLLAGKYTVVGPKSARSPEEFLADWKATPSRL